MIRKESRIINDKSIELFFDTDRQAYQVAEDAMNLLLENTEKLECYEDAEEQGLLLRLPCKVGDVVYSLTPFCEICEEYLDNEYACECCCRGNFVTETKFDYEMIRMFGKTVFLTKEEAEAALQAMQEGE